MIKIYLIYGGLSLVGLILLSGLKIIRPTQRALIERLGKYNRFISSGLTYVIPFIDSIIKVNITERMMDIEPQDIITKDNLNAKVDLVVYYQIKGDEANIKKSRYNVDDFEQQIVSLAQTTARNVIGDMPFKDVNSQRNKLNIALAKVLDKESDAWGVKVVRVEMKEIQPPKDVQESMNRVIKAENLKDASKDEAIAKEVEADGFKRAEIKKAEGMKQASILKAEGESKAFDLIEKAFKGNAQLLKKLEVTQASLQNNSKIVLTEKGISPSIIMDAIPIKSKN